MKVFKYQATGNDFIITKDAPLNPNNFSKAVCDRHFGIGADGILYPSKSDVADIKMHYYNADGTIAKMCGNGIRAFARFLVDQKIMTKPQFQVETLAGIKSVWVFDNEVKVDIGPANLNVGKPELVKDTSAIAAYDFNPFKGYVLSVGTLHTVVYMEENPKIDIKNAGIKIQNDQLFTDQTNVNFIDILDENTMKVQTFERGAGWTLSCGTGVSASVYHALLKKYVRGSNIDVIVPGGRLKVTVEGTKIYLIGPAKLIMTGDYYETH